VLEERRVERLAMRLFRVGEGAIDVEDKGCKHALVP
jgi:hypothetical protein